MEKNSLSLYLDFYLLDLLKMKMKMKKGCYIRVSIALHAAARDASSLATLCLRAIYIRDASFD